MNATNPNDWQTLSAARYLNLESLRRDGTPVRTPLWFAPAPDGTLYVYSRADAAKVKRLRHNPACRIAACDLRGNLAGSWLAATATIAAEPEAGRGTALLNRRYFPWKQLLGLLARLRPGPGHAVIALRPPR